MSAEPRPGYHSVTPRLVVADVSGLVDFFRRVFGATGEMEPGRPVELHLGDALIMVSSTGERDAFPGFLYIYVDDVDTTYDAAVQAGATTLEAPLDTPYGDRRVMVRDPFGNVLQIAHPLSVDGPGVDPSAG
jgi:PhnB protein